MRIFLRLILLSFILISSLLSFLINTTPGLYLSLKLVSLFLPGKLVIQGLQGTATHLQIKDVSYTDKFSIAVSNLNLDWQLSALFRKKFLVDQLSFDYKGFHWKTTGTVGIQKPFPALANTQIFYNAKLQGKLYFIGDL